MIVELSLFHRVDNDGAKSFDFHALDNISCSNIVVFTYMLPVPQ